MKNYILYELVNREFIERRADAKSNRYYYKAVNSYPQFYLAVYSSKNSATCAPAYLRDVKKTLKAETADGKSCWVSYDLFINVPLECLKEVNAKIKDAELFCKRLNNKHKTHVENIKKEKQEQRELKKANKKAAKKDKKKGIKGVPKNFTSNPAYSKQKEINTGGSIPWKLISSAGRGDKY